MLEVLVTFNRWLLISLLIKRTSEIPGNSKDGRKAFGIRNQHSKRDEIRRGYRSWTCARNFSADFGLFLYYFPLNFMLSSVFCRFYFIFEIRLYLTLIRLEQRRMLLINWDWIHYLRNKANGYISELLYSTFEIKISTCTWVIPWEAQNEMTSSKAGKLWLRSPFLRWKLWVVMDTSRSSTSFCLTEFIQVNI